MFKLRRYLAGHYVECVLAPLFKMLEALLQLLVPLVMAQVIDVGIATRDSGYVLWHGALLVAMGVLAWVVAVTAQFFCSRLASAFGTAMRDDLFRHVLSLSREDVERLGRASLVTRLTNDSQQVQDGLNMFFRLILRSPFVTFGTVVAAFLVDGVEGAVLLVAVLVAGTLVLGFMRVTASRYRDIQRGLDEVQLGVSENLEGVRVLRAFRREAAEREAFSAAATTVRDRQVKTGDISALVNPLTYLVINCGLIALLWFGGLQVNVGCLTQGQLVALVSYVSQALVELLKLTNLIMLLAKASACAKRINEVFETAPTLADGTLDAEPAADVPALAFDDVSFSYPGAAGDALSHVSFSLAPGATLGVIGGTGSGKSTLASLALRFYDVTDGEVKVGGSDVRTLTRHTLRPPSLARGAGRHALLGHHRVKPALGRRGCQRAGPRGRDRHRAGRGRGRRQGGRARVRGRAVWPQLLRRASASASPSRGPSCAGRASSSSTTPPPRSTLPRTPRCGAPSHTTARERP